MGTDRGRIMKRCPSTWTLRRLAAGEMDEDDSTASHLEECRDCSDQVAGMRSEAAEFLQAHPYSELLGRLEESGQAARPSRTRSWFQVWVGSIVVVAAAALVLVLHLPDVDPGKGGGTRIKGAIMVDFALADGRMGTEGMRLYEGDAIRIGYKAPRQGYLLVLSVDGSGSVTTFYNEPVQGSMHAYLPDSVVLDDAVGWERFVACYSPEPMDQDAVERAARMAWERAGHRPRAIGRVGAGCQETGFNIFKVER